MSEYPANLYKILEEVKLTEKAEHFKTFLEEVQRWNKAMRLVGNAELNTLVSIHLADSLAIWLALKEAKTVADLGTGAGFPGVVMSITETIGEVWLVERSQKKRSFLNFIVRKLPLKNAKVVSSIKEVDKNVKTLVSRAVGGFDKIANILKKSKTEFDEVWIPRGNIVSATDELKKVRGGWIGEVIEKRITERSVFLVKFSKMR